MRTQIKHQIQSNQFKIAYAHSMTFPNNEANAFDAVWTASTISEEVDTTFFVKGVKGRKQQLKTYFYIPTSRLNFQSLYFNLYPDRLLSKIKNYYQKSLALYLRFHPDWCFSKKQKVLYLRDPATMRYFGLLRNRQPWLKKWILVYESHDPLGHDPNQFTDDDPFKNDPEILEAAENFDVLICNTQALADDLHLWSKGLLSPHVITLASPLPRLKNPPQIEFGEKLKLGYIGTIDTLRGVDLLIESLRFLPENFSLRIIGRFRNEAGVDPIWLENKLRNPAIRSKLELDIVDRIDNVQAEIDRCDIMVQPASDDIYGFRYATPQKAFGYMVRGKPILVGNVPCHHELFTDGENCLMYELTSRDLAQQALFLSQHPKLATSIAHIAWKTSENFTYRRRTAEIISLIDNYKHE